jgi:hypothetical protein
MPAEGRHLPEQELSIKAREHELYVKRLPREHEGARASKPFPVYLRETPALPLSPLAKTGLWVAGAIVVALFVLSIWRITHPHHLRGRIPPSPAKAALSRTFRGPKLVRGAGSPSEEAIRVIPFLGFVEVESAATALFRWRSVRGRGEALRERRGAGDAHVGQ